jgi:hypothetical protein
MNKITQIIKISTISYETLAHPLTAGTHPPHNLQDPQHSYQSANEKKKKKKKWTEAEE